MYTSHVEITAVEPFPTVRPGDSLPDIIHESLPKPLADGDAVLIASKVVSIVENRRVELDTIQPSTEAQRLASQTGKDPRVVELILTESTSHRLGTEQGPIIAWHRLGYELTSAGVGRDGPGGAYLLPEDPDASARQLCADLAEASGAEVAVVIADSDGRPDRRGATMVTVGAAGIAPLRTTTVGGKRQEETLVDLLAAAAGIVIGQRGRGVPAAIISGVYYEHSDAGARSMLHR